MCYVYDLALAEATAIIKIQRKIIKTQNHIKINKNSELKIE